VNQKFASINAYHEAGHAIVAWLLGAKIAGVWIWPGTTTGTAAIDDEPADPNQLAMIYLAGALAQLRAHPSAWPFNAVRDFTRVDELVGDSDVRKILWIKTDAMISERCAWRAIEALAARSSTLRATDH